MPPQRPVTGSDLIPGVLSAVSFLGMVSQFGGDYLWASAGLAAAVYLGVRLLLPAPKTANAADSGIRAMVATVRRESAILTAPRLREKATAICDLSDRLLHIAETNTTRATDVYLAVGQYMDLLQQGLRVYQGGTRATTTGAQTRANLEQLLDSVYERLDALQDSIVREDDGQMAREMQTLNQTVKEMDDVVLQLRGKGETL